MALITTVAINHKPLYFVETVRLEGGDDPDSENLYQVRVFSGDPMERTESFHVKHRYGDGALALSRKVLAMTEDLRKEVES